MTPECCILSLYPLDAEYLESFAAKVDTPEDMPLILARLEEVTG